MLLSDKENAQELLSKWPEMCREHDIPCSAMHVRLQLRSMMNMGSHTITLAVFWIYRRRK